MASTLPKREQIILAVVEHLQNLPSLKVVSRRFMDHDKEKIPAHHLPYAEILSTLPSLDAKASNATPATEAACFSEFEIYVNIFIKFNDNFDSMLSQLLTEIRNEFKGNYRFIENVVAGEMTFSPLPQYLYPYIILELVFKIKYVHKVDEI